MTYNKPEIMILGDASYVIQGPKNNPPDFPNTGAPGPAAFELED
jgi:hypothetical protein